MSVQVRGLFELGYPRLVGGATSMVMGQVSAGRKLGPLDLQCLIRGMGVKVSRLYQCHSTAVKNWGGPLSRWGNEAISSPSPGVFLPRKGIGKIMMKFGFKTESHYKSRDDRFGEKDKRESA